MLESLEQRQLLASDFAITQFVAFGEEQVELDKGVSVQAGLIGSNDGVDVDKDSTTQGLVGGGKLRVDKSTIVNGDVIFNGKVEFQKQIIVHGNVDAGGKITIDKNATINGDVTSAGKIDRDSGVIVTGTTTEFGAPELFAPVSLPPITPLDEDISTGTGESTTLSPGNYGKLELGKNDVLHLSAGEYFFREIRADWNVDLVLDVTEGEIAIFVSGKVEFGKDLDVSLVGGGAENVYLETHGKFNLKKNGEWFGTIFAPFDKIVLENGTQFVGAAYSGKTVKVDEGSTLQLVPATRLLGGHGDTDAPVIAAALASDTGASGSDNITSDPAVSGAVADASIITQFLVSIPDLAAGPFDVTTQLGPGGAFLLDRALLESRLATTLGDGSYTIRLQAKDQFDNLSAFFDVPLTLDTTIATPVINSIELDTGARTSDGVTSDDNLLFHGTAEPGSTVSISRTGAGFLGTAATDVSGNWSFDFMAILIDGEYEFTATAEDLAGNTSSLSSVFAVTVDTSAPATPLNLDLVAASDTGVSNSDNLTADTTPTFSVDAEPGSLVSLFANGVLVAQGTSSGSVELTTSELADGVYDFTT
ncbi:MAG: Ig-like domain-containing protein, partial [Planctomycetota bacterium]